jgi:hypothetical protein
MTFISNPCSYRFETAAIGLHDVRGVSDGLISDHGTGVAEEINAMRALPAGSPPVNFGWPFREGTQALGGTPPSGVVDPVSSYVATGPGAIGSSIIAGVNYLNTGPVASLRQKYLFADSASGAILTVPSTGFFAGQPVPASSYENRTLDFKPDAGSLAHPILIMQLEATFVSSALVYILDRDGDLFVVSSE